MMTAKITPFTLSVADEELADLSDRLGRTRFARPLAADDWSTGVPSSYLQRLVEQWRDEYDWRAQEQRINAFPQFTTEIDGQTIHFIHVRSSHADAIPLVLTHGWPGSFVEFLDVIGPLTEPTLHGRDAADAFHVVIPSLPGFGFSTPLNGEGWTTTRIAHAWAELMPRLGYERFGAQGGDIGASVSPELGRIAPERVIGVHVNGSLGMPLGAPSEEDMAAFTPLEFDRLGRVQAFMENEFGYIAIQSTRPQALAAGLVDSPAGLLAWQVDKFKAWTMPVEALPEDVIGLDRLLTNVMIYWLTRTAGTSAFVGYAQEAAWGVEVTPSGVPTAAIMFAHDVGIRAYAERENTIARWTDVPDRGGHFAALEEPSLLLDDIGAFFRTLR